MVMALVMVIVVLATIFCGDNDDLIARVLGMDGVKLPKHGQPEVWKRGDTALVAQAITANHGGGYRYICR